MRLALVLLVATLVAPGASAVALLESSPGRALVQVAGNATLVGPGEARAAPVGEPLGPWLPARSLPLGPGGCERGLCGLVVIEVRGGEAMVIEGTSGVLVSSAPASVEATAIPSEGSAPFVPVPEAEALRPAPLAWAVVVAAFALATLRRR